MHTLLPPPQIPHYLLRIRHVWHGNNIRLIEKGNGNGAVVKESSYPILALCHHVDAFEGNDDLPPEENAVGNRKRSAIEGIKTRNPAPQPIENNGLLNDHEQSECRYIVLKNVPKQCTVERRIELASQRNEQEENTEEQRENDDFEHKADGGVPKDNR